jgi:hypothetical protein
MNATKKFRCTFGHVMGSLMHITTVSRPDLAYSIMQYSGYTACLNEPIFEALHLTMCYLYYHPHLPIMYPSKLYESCVKISSNTLENWVC